MTAPLSPLRRGVRGDQPASRRSGALRRARATPSPAHTGRRFADSVLVYVGAGTLVASLFFLSFPLFALGALVMFAWALREDGVTDG